MALAAAAATALAVACSEKVHPEQRPCTEGAHADFTPPEIDLTIGIDTVPFIHITQCGDEISDDSLYWTTTDTAVIAINEQQWIVAIGTGTGHATLNGALLGPNLGTFTVHVVAGVPPKETSDPAPAPRRAQRPVSVVHDEYSGTGVGTAAVSRKSRSPRRDP